MEQKSIIVSAIFSDTDDFISNSMSSGDLGVKNYIKALLMALLMDWINKTTITIIDHFL
jgi:hypothetical protein